MKTSDFDYYLPESSIAHRNALVFAGYNMKHVNERII